MEITPYDSILLNDLTSGESGVDITVMLPHNVVYEYIDFYDAPNCPVSNSLSIKSGQISFIVEK